MFAMNGIFTRCVKVELLQGEWRSIEGNGVFGRGRQTRLEGMTIVDECSGSINVVNVQRWEMRFKRSVDVNGGIGSSQSGKFYTPR